MAAIVGAIACSHTPTIGFHYGVIFFMLEKLGAVVGTSNLHIYAAMRGQSLEDFQKTRNAQVLYSAGGDEGKTKWDGGRK